LPMGRKQRRCCSPSMHTSPPAALPDGRQREALQAPAQRLRGRQQRGQQAPQAGRVLSWRCVIAAQHAQRRPQQQLQAQRAHILWPSPGARRDRGVWQARL
jgi:hypothetical protein